MDVSIAVLSSLGHDRRSIKCGFWLTRELAAVRVSTHDFFFFFWVLDEDSDIRRKL